MHKSFLHPIEWPIRPNTSQIMGHRVIDQIKKYILLILIVKNNNNKYNMLHF